MSIPQGSKIVLVRSYLRVSQAAGQVSILIFLLKIKFSTCMPINTVMQGKCLFSDISRPDSPFLRTHRRPSFICQACHRQLFNIGKVDVVCYTAKTRSDRDFEMSLCYTPKAFSCSEEIKYKLNHCLELAPSFP